LNVARSIQLPEIKVYRFDNTSLKIKFKKKTNCLKTIAFFDLEVDPKPEKILDIGCIFSDGISFHKNHLPDFLKFIEGADFLCGHNIFAHDLAVLTKAFCQSQFWTGEIH
jgi:hypothetical protein